MFCYEPIYFDVFFMKKKMMMMNLPAVDDDYDDNDGDVTWLWFTGYLILLWCIYSTATETDSVHCTVLSRPHNICIIIPKRII